MNIAQTIIYFDMSFLYVLLIKIDQYFLNGGYRSNHIVHDSNFLKTFETEKKYKILEKKITVKLQSP